MTEEVTHRTEGYVYVIKPVGHNVYKIGCTTDLKRRLSQHEKRTGKKMEYVHYFKSSHYTFAEQRLQLAFAHSHLSGEWFLLSDEDIATIRGISDGQL